MARLHPCIKDKICKATREALTVSQLPAEHYAGHSFRIGAATTAVMARLDDSAIQTLGWQQCHPLCLNVTLFWDR